MERSRNRTPIIQRSKGACIVALVVALGCAMFGVGGAAAGDGSYAHRLRLERQLGAALAHRSPEQLILAVTPKSRFSSRAAAVTRKSHIRWHAALATPAPTTTHAATPPQPATPAPSTTAATPPPSTTQTAATPQPATPAPSTTTTATTQTGTTTNLAAGITGPTDPTTTTIPTTTIPTTTTTTTTTTTPTTTPTTTSTTPTTTTSTTPTTTTTTPTTPTTTTTDPTTTTSTTDTTTTGDDGRTAESGVATSGTTGGVCHGRGCTGSSSTTVLPTSLPSNTSATTSQNFSLANTSLANTPPVTPTVAPLVAPNPINAISTSGSLPTPTGTTAPSSSGKKTPLGSFSNFASALSAGRLTRGTSTRRSGTGTLIASTGTGATTGGTAATGPTGSAAGTTGAAGSTGTAATHHGTGTAHKTHKPTSSGGGVLPAPITRVITQFVNVIPTAVWMALGAAFAMALAFAALALRSGRRARRREREFVAISAAAATDALTGILNRRGFMDAAERELARASRYDRPFVLAYVDVRGLKAVNDTEGHLVGDELIKAVAGLMKESARADDVVGRIGGDEFALLLDEQTAESAKPVVRRIQSRVEERRAAMEIPVPWELTIGIAAFPDDGTTLEELLGTADRRLYEQRGIALR